ncbi:hypothetical protein ACLMAL_30350 [Nocardia sp. CWNU-33]|uniref:hypothetical protein n=1 Tax=Nocardia sp. CWNU-33 TaxID=3392117 RepID=UPI00398E8B81
MDGVVPTGTITNVRVRSLDGVDLAATLVAQKSQEYQAFAIRTVAKGMTTGSALALECLVREG